MVTGGGRGELSSHGGVMGDLAAGKIAGAVVTTAGERRLLRRADANGRAIVLSSPPSALPSPGHPAAAAEIVTAATRQAEGGDGPGYAVGRCRHEISGRFKELVAAADCSAMTSAS